MHLNKVKLLAIGFNQKKEKFYKQDFLAPKNCLTPEKLALYISEKNGNLLTKFGLVLDKSNKQSVEYKKPFSICIDKN